MSHTAIWDISPTLCEATPVWPGDTPFQSSPTWQIVDGCPVRVSRITLSSHTGAHCDAPSHYHPNGIAIDQVGLTPYLGHCRVISCLGIPIIEPVHLQHALDNLPPRVLLHTYATTPTKWDAGFASVSADAIALLAQHVGQRRCMPTFVIC